MDVELCDYHIFRCERDVTMEEVILFYNISERKVRELLASFCTNQGIRPVFVDNKQYDVPVGFVAYGSDRQQAIYLREGDGPGFGDTMMVFAGFSTNRVFQLLKAMKTGGLPSINYKAVLTEYNAAWSSVQLFDQLEEERRSFG